MLQIILQHDLRYTTVTIPTLKPNGFETKAREIKQSKPIEFSKQHNNRRVADKEHQRSVQVVYL